MTTCSLHIPGSCSFTFPDREPRSSATKPVNPSLHQSYCPLRPSRDCSWGEEGRGGGRDDRPIPTSQPPDPRHLPPGCVINFLQSVILSFTPPPSACQVRRSPAAPVPAPQGPASITALAVTRAVTSMAYRSITRVRHHCLGCPASPCSCYPVTLHLAMHHCLPHPAYITLSHPSPYPAILHPTPFHPASVPLSPISPWLILSV